MEGLPCGGGYGYCGWFGGGAAVGAAAVAEVDTEVEEANVSSRSGDRSPFGKREPLSIVTNQVSIIRQFDICPSKLFNYLPN